MARIRSMGDEAISSISSAHYVGSGLTNLSRSDSVRRVLDTPEGFGRVVSTGSGDLTLGVPRTPERTRPGEMSEGPPGVPRGPARTTPGEMTEGPLMNLRLTREQLENMTYQGLS
ncbi:MAG: hypothetical protein ACKPKO_03440 [Candidatus Fonsibacter sp.]